MNNFYVYIYLDPRKHGKYVYGDYEFDYEPFYVGKGHENRYNDHLREAKNYNIKYVGNKHKYYKILKILEAGLEPIILKVEEGLIERDAFDLEIWMIWAIGRSDLELGPLTNLTDGGEGISGQVFSEETKQKMSDAAKGKIVSEETKEKLRKYKGKLHRCYGKHLPEETRQKISEAQMGEKNHRYGKKLSPIHYQKLLESHTGKNNWLYGKNFPQKMKDNLSVKMKGKQNHLGKKHSKQSKQKMSDAHIGKILSKEHKRKISQSNKGNDSGSKTYKIVYPDGTINIIRNMFRFCKENNLNSVCMSNVALGISSQHKGFTCSIINNITEE